MNVLCETNLSGQTREEKVRADRARVEAEGFWIYNDLPRALRQAEATGKPILVVLRCIPCEECVKLDDDLVVQDPVIRPLLDRFVCARVVSTNGLDLDLFQFDTDQSFAVFFLSADKTIYGRFGTRSHQTDWLGDVSLKGLAAAMQGALELHANYPQNASQLVGKKGPPQGIRFPEQYPSLKEKYTSSLNYEGNVVASCIHCHQIGDAQRDEYRAKGEPLPERVLFPFPHPKAIGLILDPDERAMVKQVRPDTPAARAGFQVGDVIEVLQNQPLLSMADVQWILHQTPAKGGRLAAVVTRNGKQIDLTLTLEDGWRRAGDISWRVSSWGLCRMTTGGMRLDDTTADSRRRAAVGDDKMALHVRHVGQYGEHAVAKRAGLQRGDILVKYGGREDLFRESDVFRHGLSFGQPGQELPIAIVRDGKRLELELLMQE